jgi:hypothetical protein
VDDGGHSKRMPTPRLSVILSAAKARPERSRRDPMPIASGDEVLRCAQDDNRGSESRRGAPPVDNNGAILATY